MARGSGLIFGGAYVWREIFVSKSIGRKLYRLLLCFTLYFEGNFQVHKLLRGDLTERFLRYEFGGLIFEGAYTWRGLFSEFYGSLMVFRGPLSSLRTTSDAWESGPGGGGGTRPIFIQGGPAPRSNTLPGLTLFFHGKKEKRYPFRIPSIDKWSVSHTSFWTLHPFNWCKCIVI